MPKKGELKAVTIYLPPGSIEQLNGEGGEEGFDEDADEDVYSGEKWYDPIEFRTFPSKRFPVELKLEGAELSALEFDEDDETQGMFNPASTEPDLIAERLTFLEKLRKKYSSDAAYRLFYDENGGYSLAESRKGKLRVLLKGGVEDFQALWKEFNDILEDAAGVFIGKAEIDFPTSYKGYLLPDDFLKMPANVERSRGGDKYCLFVQKGGKPDLAALGERSSWQSRDNRNLWIKSEGTLGEVMDYIVYGGFANSAAEDLNFKCLARYGSDASQYQPVAADFAGGGKKK
ncbi:MAG: hypothetical protein V1820_02450 [archaeon]